MEQTSHLAMHMSASDPKPTWRAGQGDKVIANGAWKSAILLDVRP